MIIYICLIGDLLKVNPLIQNSVVLSIKLKLLSQEALWHMCLGHTSKNKVERLVLNGILSSIDFTNFDVYVKCVKGKQTKSMRSEAMSSIIPN